MEQPLISVIMPAYNCEAYVKQAIDSVLGQSHRNLELLIADDRSTDSTRKIIDSYTDTRIVRHHNDSNMGYLRTCNKLFAACKGQYITFQDADDFSAKDRLELLLCFMNSNAGLDACGSNYVRVTEQGEEVYCSNYLTDKKDILAELPQTFNCCGASMIISRKVLETIGGYHVLFDRIGSEDYYWFYLICEKFEYANLRTPLYFYRSNSKSVSGDIDDPRKTYSTSIVCFLIEQRKQTGTDSLGNIDTAVLEQYVISLNEEFRKDPSLFYRRMASKAFDEGKVARMFRYALKALLKEPFKVYNLRTLFYFTRKVLLTKLSKK